MKKSKYSNPQFSIIIPCKNSYKYILKALDSIFIQNFNDFEILVIDDNSSDNSKELVTKWIENHLQMKEKLYKKSVSKRGPGGARNVGLLHAKGKYIIFLDAYDELLPDSLSAIDNTIKNNNYPNILLLNHKLVY